MEGFEKIFHILISPEVLLLLNLFGGQGVKRLGNSGVASGRFGVLRTVLLVEGMILHKVKKEENLDFSNYSKHR